MNNHVMDKTPRILTIVGLVLEGFAAFSSLIAGYIFVNIDRFAFIDEIYATMPEDEQWIFDLMSGVIGVVMLVLGVILIIMFIVNITLFTKLMRGEFSKDSAKKVYKYQIIWGIISLLMNTVTGILYLISGFQGYESLKNMVDKDEVY